jgi:hypothetical protein
LYISTFQFVANSLSKAKKLKLEVIFGTVRDAVTGIWRKLHISLFLERDCPGKVVMW